MIQLSPPSNRQAPAALFLATLDTHKVLHQQVRGLQELLRLGHQVPQRKEGVRNRLSGMLSCVIRQQVQQIVSVPTMLVSWAATRWSAVKYRVISCAAPPPVSRDRKPLLWVATYARATITTHDLATAVTSQAGGAWRR